MLDLYRQLNPENPDLKRGGNIAELWKKILNNPNLYYFVLKKDGKIVSSCTLAIMKSFTRGRRSYRLIEYMITDSRYRKRGYGTAIINKAVEVAKEKNCYKVMLLTG